MEMHNPFGKRPARPEPPPQHLNPKDLAKISVIAVILILTLLAMIMLQVFTKKPQASRPALAPDEINYSIRREDPLSKKARELALAWPAGRELDVQSRPFLDVLDFLRTDMTPEGISSRSQRIPVQLLADDPEARRGQFIFLAGRAEGFARVPLAGRDDDAVGVGTFLAQGASVPVTTVLTTQAGLPAPDAPWEIEGIFLGTAQGRPILVIRNIRAAETPVSNRQTSPDQPERPLKETVAEFQDGTVDIDRESPAFVALIGAMKNSLTSEGVAKAAREDVGLDALLAAPAAHRGDFIRVRGHLVTMVPKPVNVTNPDNVAIVNWGVVMAAPYQKPVHFYLLDPPQGEIKPYLKFGKLLTHCQVEVEGVFLRLYTYEGERFQDYPQQTWTAPVLFAKNVRVIPPQPTQDPRGGFALLVLGAGVVVAVIIVLAGVISRRQSRGSLRQIMLEARRQRTPSSGKPPSPG
ncbi:MAG: hypothetical protein HYY16_04630 [Planctomycetes bacterium]|nr:hypothetical protein [Planctomycetota bacterium]